MKEALTYMFKDENFLKKYLTVFIFILIPFLLILSIVFWHINKISNDLMIIFFILFILGLILSLIPQGYGISCIKNLMKNEENTLLPSFDFIRNFSLGFKFFIANVFVGTVIFLSYMIMIIPVIILAVVLFHSKDFANIINNCLFIIYMMFIITISPALMAIFAKTEWLSALLRFKRAVKIINNDKKRYFKNLGLLFAFCIIFTTITSIVGIKTETSNITLVLYAIFMAVCNSYFNFVFAYFIAKSVDSEIIIKE